MWAALWGRGWGQHQPGRGALRSGVLAGHLDYEQADGQARERGQRAGRGGQSVCHGHRCARGGLDVTDVPGHADRQAAQRGGPGPDPLPGGPGVQVGDVEGEFPDGQEHVDLGRPGHRLPAGQPVMDRPVVQTRVAVGQGVGAGEDGDHSDRVQGRLARAGIHAGFRRFRIRLSASSAVSSAVGRLCRYFSVVEMLA